MTLLLVLTVVFGSVIGALILGLCFRMIYDRFFSSPPRSSDPFTTSDRGFERLSSTQISYPSASDTDLRSSNKDQVELQPPKPWNQSHRRISSLPKGYTGRLYSQDQPSKIALNPEGYDSRKFSADITSSTFRNDDAGDNDAAGNIRDRRQGSGDVGWGSSVQLANINDPPTYSKF